MMKSAVLVPLFATAALAATSSLIPDGITTGCSSYLAKLNSNTTLSACTTPLIAATKAFQPGASSSNTTKAAITSALTSLCSTTTENACPSSTLRGILTDFYSACPAELSTSPNGDVIKMYDALYMVVPLRNAACSKTDSGTFCALASTAVTGTSSSSASASASSTSASSSTPKLANGASLSNVQAYLSEDDNGYSTPNETTWTSSNAPFLFYQPNLSSAQLCTTCMQGIMSSFISFETLCSYAPGLSNSKLLSGQTALYNAITSTCGANFLQGAVQAAGSLNSGLTGKSKSGAEKNVAQFGLAATAVGALFMAVAAL